MSYNLCAWVSLKLTSICRTGKCELLCAWQQEEAARYKYPHVVDFLDYVKHRWMVNFRKLEEPKVPHLTLLSCSSAVFTLCG